MNLSKILLTLTAFAILAFACFSFLQTDSAQASGIPTWESEEAFSLPNSSNRFTSYDDAMLRAGGTAGNVLVAIRNYIQFFLYFVAVLLLIAIVYGAWEYMTAYGDESKAQNGIAAIKYAVVGLIIATVSWSLTHLLVTGLPRGDINADRSAYDSTCTYVCSVDSDCKGYDLLGAHTCHDGCCRINW